MSGGILVVTYGGGHVNMVIPVIRELSLRHQVTVLGLTAAGPALTAAGIPFLGFKNFLDAEDATARRWGEQLAAGLPVGAVPHDESVAYLGLSYADLIAERGEAGAAAAFAKQGRQAFLPIPTLRRILARLRPEVVLATNAPRAEQAALIVAKEMGLRSACLLDLFGIDMPLLAQPGYGDVLMVLSEEVREFLVTQGRPRNELAVTGNPAFDALTDASIPAQAAAWRVAKGLENRTVILLATQPTPAFPGLNHDVAQRLAAIAQRRDWMVVVRPHPNEAVWSQPAGVITSDPGESLPALLAASDVVVTYTSTVGLQGHLLGRPLVQLGFGPDIARTPYAQMGMAVLASTLDEMEAAVIKATLTKSRAIPKTTQRGNATQAVVACVAGLLAARSGV